MAAVAPTPDVGVGDGATAAASVALTPGPQAQQDDEVGGPSAPPTTPSRATTPGLVSSGQVASPPREVRHDRSVCRNTHAGPTS